MIEKSSYTFRILTERLLCSRNRVRLWKYDRSDFCTMKFILEKKINMKHNSWLQLSIQNKMCYYYFYAVEIYFSLQLLYSILDFHFQDEFILLKHNYVKHTDYKKTNLNRKQFEIIWISIVNSYWLKMR